MAGPNGSGRNDFYIEFGSNAKQFSEGLLRQLKGAQQAVAAVDSQMDKLVARSAAARSNVEGAAKAASGGSSGGGSGGGDLDKSVFRDIANIMAETAKHASSLNDSYATVESNITGVVKALDRATKKLSKGAEKLSRKEGAAARTDNQQRVIRSGTFAGKEPIEGVTTPARKPRPRPVYDDDGARVRTPRQRVTISGTPQAVVDDATLNRVIVSIERGNAVQSALLDVAQQIAARIGDQRIATTPTTAAQLPKTPKDEGGPSKRALGSQIASLQSQIDKRVRLSAATTELKRLGDGGKFDQRTFDRLAGGSKSLIALGQKSGYSGEEYAKRIERVVERLSEETQGTPRIKTMRGELAELKALRDATQGDASDAPKSATKADASAKNIAEAARARQDRLEALVAELARARSGKEFDPDLFARAAMGSSSITKAGEKHGFAGPKYEERLSRAITALSERIAQGGGTSPSSKVHSLADVSDEVSPGGGKKVRKAKAEVNEADELSGALESSVEEFIQLDGDLAAKLNELKVPDAIVKQIAALENLNRQVDDLGSAMAASDKTKDDPKALALFNDIKTARDAAARQVNELLKEYGIDKDGRQAINKAAHADATKAKGDRSLPYGERANISRDLALGGDEATLRKLKKDDLRRVLTSYGQEGYEADFNPMSDKAGGERVTNDRLIEAILKSNQRYKESGGTTVHDLRTPDGVKPSSISKDAARLISTVKKIYQETESELAALAVIDLNFKTGGESGTKLFPRGGKGSRALTDDQGNTERVGRGDKTAKGRVQRGSAFGGEADKLVDEAEKIILDMAQRQLKSGIHKVLKMAQGGTKFDPYDRGIDEGIKGNQQDAKKARIAVAKVRRQTRAIDDRFAEYMELDSNVQRETKAISAMEARLTSLERQATQDDKDIQEIHSLKERIKAGDDSRKRLADRRDNLMLDPAEFTPARAFDTPEFRAGVVERRKKRDEFDRGREQRDIAIREKEENNAAWRDAWEQFLGGSTQFANIKSGRMGPLGAENFYRQLPNLRPTGKGGMTDLDNTVLQANPKLLKKFNEQLKRYLRAMSDVGDELDVPEATRIEGRVDALRELLGIYDQMNIGERRIEADPETGAPRLRPELNDSVNTIKGNDRALAKASKKRAEESEKAVAEIVSAIDAGEEIAVPTAKKKRRKGASGDGGGGSGDGGTPSAPGVDGPGSGDLLTRILARLDAIHQSIKTGVAVRKGTVSAAQPGDAAEVTEATTKAAAAVEKSATKLASVTEEVGSDARPDVEDGATPTPMVSQAAKPQEQQVASDQQIADLAETTQRVTEATAALAAAVEAVENAKDAVAKSSSEADVARKNAEAADAASTRRAEIVASSPEVTERSPQEKAARAAFIKAQDGLIKAMQERKAAENLLTKSTERRDRIKELWSAEQAAASPYASAERRKIITPARRAAMESAISQADAEVMARSSAYDAKNQIFEQRRREVAARQSVVQADQAKQQERVRAAFDASRSLRPEESQALDAHLAAQRALELAKHEYALAEAALNTAETDLAGAKRDRETAAAAMPQKAESARAKADEVKAGDGAIVEAAKARRAKEEAKAAAPQVSQAQANRAAKQAVDGRNSARTLTNLDVIYSRLSETTKGAIATLRELQMSGKSVADQQVRVFSAMSRDLGQHGIGAAGVRGSFKEVLADPRIPAKQRITNLPVTEMNNISRAANIQDPTLRRTGRMMGTQVGADMGDGAMAAFAQTMFGNHGFWSRVMNSTGTFIIRNFTAGFVFGITAALKDVITQAIETESTFVRVSHALEATGRSVGSLRTDLQNISTDYGVALLDVYETAAGLTGLFKTTEEIAGATRVVAQLQMISKGALNAQEAMGALASISSAFDLTGIEGVEHIADVLTTIQNRLGVNLEVSAEGVGRLAGLAAQLELSFEETAVYVSEIAKRTNQTGAAAGEQFSRIIAAMQTGRGQKVLAESLGDEGIGDSLAAGNYSDALRILMENYQDLTKSQQDNIATTLGGQRQAASLAALLKDGAGALDTIAAAEDSNGAAMDRAAKISQTLNAQLERLQQNFVNFGAALVQTGVLNVFAAALGGVNLFLGGLNKLLSVMNQFTSSSPFMEFIKNVGMGIVGLAVSLRLLRAGLAGFRQAMNANTMMGAATRGFVGVDEEGKKRPSMMAAARGRLATAAGREIPVRGGFGEAWDAARRQGAYKNVDRVLAPTTTLGKGLEKVTSGPLQRFGKALQTSAGWVADRSTIIHSGDTRTSTVGRVTSATLDRAGTGFDRLGRRLENVTSGPLQRFSGSLQRLGGALQASAGWMADSSTIVRNATTARDGERYTGLTGRATSAALGRTGLGSDRIGRGLEAILRGRGMETIGGAMQRRGNLYLSRVPLPGSIPTLPGTHTAPFNRAMGNALSGAGRAMSTFGQSLRAVSMGGIAAQGAMMGLSMAMTAVIMEMVRAEQFSRDVERAYKSRFTEDYGASDEEKANRYTGPATDLVKKNAESLEGFSGFMRAMGDTWGTIGKNMGRIVTLDWDKFESIDIRSDKAAGVIPDDVGSDIADLNTQILARYKELMNNEGVTLEDVATAQTDFSKKINDEATKIFNDDTLSNEQKTSALSELEKASKLVGTVGDNAIRKIQGLSDLEKMTTGRINEILSLMGTLASAPTAGRNFSGSVEVLMSQLGPSSSDRDLTEAFGTLASGSASSVEILEAQLAIQSELMAQAEANLRSAVAKGSEEDDIQAKQQQLSQLLTSVDQMRSQIVQAEVAAASDMATYLEGSGNYQGAVDSLRASAEKIRQKVAESRNRKANESYNTGLDRAGVPSYVKRKDVTGQIMSDEAEQQATNQANQLAYQATDKAVAQAERNDRMAAMQTRNSVSLAAIQLSMANRRVEALKDQEGREMELLAAEEQAYAAANSLADAEQARIQARYQAQAAGMLNAVSKARTEEAGAWAAANFALNQFGANSAEYLQALAGARSASQAATQAALDEAAAARDTLLARIAPGDSVAKARQTLSNAKAAQRDAARFGQSSVQYQQATQAVIEAQRGVSDAVFTVTTANSNLAIAIAQAAGKSVDVAREQLRQARRELKRAKRRSGGERTPEVIDAEAGVKSAEANLRDQALQERMSTIDYQLQMEEITARAAIDMLTQLLNTKDLTEQQRREILLKIKGLQDELSSTMSGVFNLPENIKVPTVYEVRRAMGVDDYLKSMKDATDITPITGSGGAPGAASADQILREIRDGLAKYGSAATSQVQDYSHSNNQVTINGASFDDVIKWLRENLGAGAQVTRTNTGRKGR